MSAPIALRLMRHYVGRIVDRESATPEQYEAFASGYRRRELVDHTISPAAVHMGLGLVDIEPGGYLMPVLHAFEKAFYVLQGTLVASIADRAYRLSGDYYGVIPKATRYSLYNAGDTPARLLEMMAPQPAIPESGFRDTLFSSDGALVRQAEPPDLADPLTKRIGRFDESQVPSAGQISGTGARSASIRGVSIAEFVDRTFGSHHLSMFLVQFQPGGAGTEHDHPHEESYFLLSGKAEATLDGQKYLVEPGHYVWTGVGCFHGFAAVGREPVRWIETQAPLPADFEAFRFRSEWDPLSR